MVGEAMCERASPASVFTEINNLRPYELVAWVNLHSNKASAKALQHAAVGQMTYSICLSLALLTASE